MINIENAEVTPNIRKHYQSHTVHIVTSIWILHRGKIQLEHRVTEAMGDGPS